MIKCIAVHSGYVESSSIGVVLFTHPQGFETLPVAVRSLADAIFNKLHEDTGPSAKKACCKKTLEKDPEAVYCSKCRSTVGERPFDFEAHEDEVRHLLNSTADSFGGGELVDEDGYEWNPWNSIQKIMKLDPSEVHEIQSYGERVLTMMISPELLPEGSRGALQEWVEGIYIEQEDRKKLGLSKYKHN